MLFYVAGPDAPAGGGGDGPSQAKQMSEMTSVMVDAGDNGKNTLREHIIRIGSNSA